ncbi:hypothetical protein LWI28_000783 [Acer negundo]|uniref:Uncharacterized protein n=1 Tax=Acer negundo TaxID=4023 RepID=A0AAD5P3L9_ACENE|nr:hypothetical protein LWI28_000783 [Acer negundo]
MQILLKNQRSLLATQLVAFGSTPRATFSTSAFLKWDGGVSMVQGASRGIGLEFVKQLLEKNDKGHVIATCRNPNGATGLLDLKNKFAERLDILHLDLAVESTIEASATSVREKWLFKPSHQCIWHSINPECVATRNNIEQMGPILVIKHIWPLLKVGGGTGTERDVAVVANLSARVGSIGDNRLGGWHSYRSSKAALNQLTKNVSVEFARKKDPVIILLHPGTVDTVVQAVSE